MSPTADPIDPARCPLCGAGNHCAVAGQQDDNPEPSPCWCTRANFSGALLRRLPDAARGAACICPACAGAGPAQA